MKVHGRAARTWWLALGLIPLLAATASAGPSEANLVGNAATGSGESGAGTARDASHVDSTAWGNTGAKGAVQPNINQKVKFYAWDQTKVSDAKKALDDRAKADSALAAKLAAIKKQRDLKDLHPVEYLEWLKLQNDKDLAFIQPPQNEIQIVDQEALAKMDKSKIAVKYKKTTICPRVVTYKPTYKTITVYYPG